MVGGQGPPAVECGGRWAEILEGAAVASRPLGLAEQALWLRPPAGERRFPLFAGRSGCRSG